MICPLTDNFRAVISRACKMLNEMDMTDSSNLLMFFASIDYSDLKAAQLKATQYLTQRLKRNAENK
jgi:hypothetical protein